MAFSVLRKFWLLLLSVTEEISLVLEAGEAW